MSWYFLMTFTLVDSVDTFTNGTMERAREGTQRISVARRFDFHLLADARVSLTQLGTPVQIRAFKVDQSSWSGRLRRVGIRGIMVG
jgi:hypothetical protein